MEVRDEDFFLINRDDKSYKISASDLRDQMEGKVDFTIEQPDIIFPDEMPVLYLVH